MKTRVSFSERRNFKSWSNNQAKCCTWIQAMYGLQLALPKLWGEYADKDAIRTLEDSHQLVDTGLIMTYSFLKAA